MAEIVLEHRGIERYGDTYARQKELQQLVIDRDAPSTVITVVHPPVITLGRSAQQSDILVGADILREKGVECFEVERGGKVTYHGLGQAVIYPVIDLRLFGRDIHRYLRALEHTAIGVLGQLGLKGVPGPEAGVFVEKRKIASIGVAVRKWVTCHGLSFNAKKDPNIGLINPCGMNASAITTLEQEGVDLGPARAAELLAGEFIRVICEQEQGPER